MSLNNDSFGEKDEKGWYHIHVTEDVKLKILGDLEFTKNWKQFLEDNPMILKEYPQFNQIINKIKSILEPFPKGNFDIEAVEDCIDACNQIIKTLKETN